MTNTNTSEWMAMAPNVWKMADGSEAVWERIQIKIDHGIVDYKGREIGGHAVIATRGGEVHLNVSPTRNGDKFGALTRSTKCATIEQAKALAKRKLDAQRTRYAKAPGNKVIGPATCAKNGHGPHVRAPLDAQCIHCQARLAAVDSAWHAA